MKAGRLLLIMAITGLLAGCGQPDQFSAQLKSPNVMVRKQAVAAISGSLQQRLMRTGALWLNDPRPSEWAVRQIASLLNDESEEVRLAAINALGNMGYPQAIKPLLGLLGSQSNAVRTKTVEALGKLQAREAVPALVGCIQSEQKQAEDERLLLTAIWALGNIGDPAACTPLSRLLSSDDAFVRYNAAQALKKLE